MSEEKVPLDTLSSSSTKEPLSIDKKGNRVSFVSQNASCEKIADIKQSLDEEVSCAKWSKEKQLRKKMMKKNVSKHVFDPHKTKKHTFFSFIKGLPFLPQKDVCYRNIAQFCVIGVVLVICINIIAAYNYALVNKNRVQGYVEDGYSQFLQAGDSLKQTNFHDALLFLAQADESFQDAKEIFSFASEEKSFSLENKSMKTSLSLIFESGKHVTEASKNMIHFMSSFQHYFEQKVASPDYKVVLQDIFQYFDTALYEVSEADHKMQKVSLEMFPGEMKEKLLKARQKISEIHLWLSLLNSYKSTFLKLLGDPHPQRYLILLQNNNEIRPSGGFIGSFFVVQVNDGVVEKHNFHDVYEIDNQLLETIPAPEGLDEISDYWGMRDANFIPDFSLAVNDIRWFLDKGKGPTVNSVIAIDQTLVEALLELTGPIYLSDYDLEVSAENFSFVISYIVEAKLIQDVTPKKIIFDMVPVIQEKLKQVAPSEIINVFFEALEKKHIVLYFDDAEVQSVLSSFGVTGELMKVLPDDDYFHLVYTSISGNKSDPYIENKLYHKTVVKNNGEIENNIIIEREHFWGDQQESNFNKLVQQFGTGKYQASYLKGILGKGENQQYVRVYLPLGVELLDFDSDYEVTIEEEYGKSVVKFLTSKIAPGEKEKIEFSYKLPFQFTPNRQILTLRTYFQKQIGMSGIKLFKDIVFEGERYNILQSFPDTMTQLENGGVSFYTLFESDTIFESILKNEEYVSATEPVFGISFHE